MRSLDGALIGVMTDALAGSLMGSPKDRLMRARKSSPIRAPKGRLMRALMMGLER